MKRLQGLSALTQAVPGRVNAKILSNLLLDDLSDCYCEIFGSKDGQPVLLTRLSLLTDSLEYEPFDQRIDLTLTGLILRNDCVPLTYRLQGGVLAVTGRCSMIGKVCGVDLYLSKSYTGQQGDTVRQRFKLDVKELLHQVSKQH